MDVPESGKKFGKTIPVIIENHKNGIKKTKIMVPSHYTASQLLNILRLKTHMNPHHPLYLFLKAKHRPLLMSKCIGHLHQKYRDEKGCLHLIQADQSTFGFRGNIRAIRFRQKWIESVVSSGHAHHDVLPPYYFPGASSPSPHSNDSWGDMFDSEESFYVMNIDPLMTTDTETGVQEISLQMGTVQSFPLNTDPPPTNTPVNLQDFIQNTPPPSENSPMNTTTIQLMQGTSHTVNGLSIQVMQPTTLVQTTTIQFVQSGEITSSLELVAQPSLVPPNVNYNFLPEPNFEYLQETGINESPLHPLSPINPEQIVTTPNQLIHPASDQLAADAQLQSPNQQLNTTTIQLLDPNSQQVNASVEWMQLGNQVMSNDAYEAMLLLPPLAMSNLQAESEEEIFALVPY